MRLIKANKIEHITPCKAYSRVTLPPLGRLHGHSSGGYILPIVLVLLVAVMLGSLSFFNRVNDSTELSTATRDYEQAVLLSESAGNWVLGRLQNNVSPTIASPSRCPAKAVLPAASTVAQPGDLNCDGRADYEQARIADPGPSLPLTLSYEYYLSDAGDTLRANTPPGILQMIADGEARNTGTALTNQAIPSGTTRLLVNNLFIGAVRPILLIQTATGLVNSGSTWTAETSAEKAAVWLEITRNGSGTRDLYLSSVSRVGNAKAYLQRYVGTLNSGVGSLAALNEARPF